VRPPIAAADSYGMSGSAGPDGPGRPSQALRECLVAATAAPSIHNTQPWLFRPRGDTVDVLVDRRRQLGTLDPDGREMLVSVGAAVLNLRLAIRAHGRQTQVGLMPDPDEPHLVARLSIGEPAAAPANVLALYQAIGRRHTNRRPFADRPVPHGTMEELAAAASAEGAALLAVDPALRDGVLSLTRTAENRMRTDHRYRAELAAWTTPGGVGRRDGVPRQAFGPRDADGALPLRDFALGHGAPTATVAFEPDPTLILLFTDRDTRVDWLRAGAALQRVLLTGTLRGLAATPLSQLLEVPRLRALLADSVTGQVAQTVLRIGYPTTPAPATPRRPVEEVVVGWDQAPAS
jgi:nitroreductase